MEDHARTKIYKTAIWTSGQCRSILRQYLLDGGIIFLVLFVLMGKASTDLVLLEATKLSACMSHRPWTRITLHMLIIHRYRLNDSCTDIPSFTSCFVNSSLLPRFCSHSSIPTTIDLRFIMVPSLALVDTISPGSTSRLDTVMRTRTA